MTEKLYKLHKSNHLFFEDFLSRVEYHHKRYETKKSEAKSRGIAWEFTFISWLKWWGDDLEKWSKQDLCCCRYRDTGPYSPRNCYKGTSKDNAQDASYHGKLKAKKRRCSVRTPQSDWISFDSITDAALHYNVSSGILYFIGKNKKGFYTNKWGTFEVVLGDVVIESATSRLSSPSYKIDK